MNTKVALSQGKNVEMLRGLTDEAARKALSEIEDKVRGDGPETWPYFYSFIDYPFLKGAPAGNRNEFYSLPTGVTADGPDGFTLPASGMVDVNIAIRSDADFHLLQIKYSVWNPTNAAAGVVNTDGTREFLAQPQTSLQGGRTLFMASATQRIPWTSMVDAQAFINSGRDLYGGLQKAGLTQGVSEVFMPLQSMQGADDGMGQMRLAALLNRSGFIKIRLRNRSTTALRVHGHAFGYSIA